MYLYISTIGNCAYILGGIIYLDFLYLPKFKFVN